METKIISKKYIDWILFTFREVIAYQRKYLEYAKLWGDSKIATEIILSDLNNTEAINAMKKMGFKAKPRGTQDGLTKIGKIRYRMERKRKLTKEENNTLGNLQFFSFTDDGGFVMDNGRSGKLLKEVNKKIFLRYKKRLEKILLKNDILYKDIIGIILLYVPVE